MNVDYTKYESWAKSLAVAYNEYLIHIAREDNVITKLCPYQMKEAYKEIYLDILFLSARRLPKGVGKCKVAGITLWRLCKNQFIRNTGMEICNSSDNNHSFNVSLTFVLHNVLNIKDIKEIKTKYKSEFKEIEHLMRKRHINQESVALIFKMICKNLTPNCCEVEE